MLGIYHEIQRRSLTVVYRVEKECGEYMRRKIKVLRSDNSGEYTSDLSYNYVATREYKGTSRETQQ